VVGCQGRSSSNIVYRIDDIFHCYSPVTAHFEWCLPKLFQCKGQGEMVGQRNTNM
jgi:hypothetical protein